MRTPDALAAIVDAETMIVELDEAGHVRTDKAVPAEVIQALEADPEITREFMNREIFPSAENLIHRIEAAKPEKLSRDYIERRYSSWIVESVRDMSKARTPRGQGGISEIFEAYARENEWEVFTEQETGIIHIGDLISTKKASAELRRLINEDPAAADDYIQRERARDGSAQPRPTAATRTPPAPRRRTTRTASDIAKKHISNYFGITPNA